MSAASPGTPSEDAGTRSTGPGHLLRTARESAGMGVREVSAQLRLDERTVTALESDDFKDLPAPTFVRGYLRGYARLLGVPVGPVMEAYDREGFAPPDLVADIAETPDASTRDIPVRLATLGVVVVLVVLVVLWWNNQAFNDLPAPVPQSTGEPEIVRPVTPATTVSPAAAPAQASEDRSAAMQGGTGSRDESAEPTPEPSTGQTGTPIPSPTPGVPADSAVSTAPTPPATPAAEVDQVIAQAEGVLERARDEVDAIVRNPGAAAAEGAGSPATAAETSASSSGPAATATPAEAQPTGASEGASGEARLVIRIPIEAWVEIYDRDDARLFYNLARPGSVIDVSGVPPIRVLLGRTRGVTLEFNGEAVDLTPHTERGVARLTLGR